MENQSIEMLPAEVAQIAQNVSVEKRNEVQVVLNQVFNGVAKMREQLDQIEVSNENDKVSMQMARTIRLAVREDRLNAEKTFDSKRGEVQQQMLSYKTEDSLWLKAKQTMQILTKEIEEQAKWKEDTKVRFEAEQKEIATQQRMLKVAKVAPEVLRSEFENMSEETFVMFLGGITKAYNDKVEAEKKVEEERLDNLRKEEERRSRFEVRNKELAPYWASMKSFPNSSTFNYTDATNEEYKEFLDSAIKDKLDYEAKQEQIRIENERLKAEAELKEKQLAKEREESERALLAERKEAQEKLEKEMAEARKLASELKAKQDAEIAAEKERIDAENKAKAEAKKLAKSGDKAILSNWIDSFQAPNCLGLSSNSEKTYNEIYDKFESFKKWAKTEVEKI